MSSRRLNVAILLIVFSGLFIAPAFFLGGFGGLFLLVPLFAAVVIALKPRPPT